ncbi:MAG: amidohydrolase family protein [Solobacterium sp.]|nr:amidohydrolase family protein [Solobacterium sp.]
MHVIKNGTIYTMKDSSPFKGDILISDDGKIKAIGTDLGTTDAEITDAEEKTVIPGFVDAHSHIGGVWMESEDLNEMSNPVTPEMDSYYGIDPKDKQFETAVSCGITTSCLIPGSGNVIGGWGIVLKSSGDSFKDRLLKHPVCLKAATGINPKGVYSGRNQLPMTRMGIAFLLRDYLRRVKEYMEKKEKYRDEPDKMPPYDLGLEHGIPVIEKKIPLKVHTYMHDMVTVVDIAREFDILVTIDHAQGASDFYDDLCDPHVKGVIFGPISAGLFPGEGGKIDFECCKGLHDRGVKVTVMTDGPVTPENLLIYQAGEAVRKGMDPVDALGMITKTASEIILCDDRVGTLEEGKDADIQIYDALPTLYTSAVLEKIWINGKEVNIK